LAPGEKLQYVFQCQTGVSPAMLWLPFARWLVALNRARIVAFTDQRIAVFAAGQLSWQRRTPRQLLYSLPRNTVLVRGSGSWSKIAVGSEGMWFSRKLYPLLDEANATSIPAQATGPVAGWYPDPGNGRSLRWWDGTRWTDQSR
jgi:hypothetical protein